MSRQQPKTAYGLLKHIARLIRREPQHYYQETWYSNDGDFRSDSALLCGTTCCVAGHILCETRGHAQGIRAMKTGTTSVLTLALRQLGLLGKTRVWCDATPYSPAYSAIRALFLYVGSFDLTPGTTEYAEAGAAKIEALCEEHKTELKAARVRYPRSRQ